MMSDLYDQSSQQLIAQLRNKSAGDLLAFSRRAGVDPRETRHLLRSRPLSATSYLLICNALGIDPVTAAPRVPVLLADFTFSFALFGTALRFARRQKLLSIRDAARQVGVSTATLSRAETARPVTPQCLLKICAFFRLRPDAFLVFTGNSHCNIASNLDNSGSGSVCECKNSGGHDDA